MASNKFEPNEKELEKLVTLYRYNFTDEQVAAYFGIHENKLKRFLKRRDSAGIVQRIEKEKIEALLSGRQALFEKATKDKDATAIKMQMINFDDSIDFRGDNRNQSILFNIVQHL